MAVRCPMPVPNDRYSMQPVSFEMGMNLDDYWFEMKLDGWRAFLRWDGTTLQFISRHGKDITGFFPELKEIESALPSDCLLIDGEIVAFDLDGKVRRGLLNKKTRSRIVFYYSFDLIYRAKELFVDEPLSRRRELLEELSIDHLCFILSPIGRTPQEKLKITENSKLDGHEGIVAKHPDRKYTCGKASKWWIKFKHRATSSR